MEIIKLNSNEIMSNFDRVAFAETLILQLPENHDGKNTWLLNYGRSDFARNLRKQKNLNFDDETQSCELTNNNQKEIAFDWNAFKEYVNTYDPQKHGLNRKKTIINDMLYGIGLSTCREKYRYADGYAKFKQFLKELFNDKKN